MTNLLLVILHEAGHLPALLDAWHNLGLPGATIFNNVGGYRARTWLDEMGLGALGDLFRARAVQGKTLLLVIEEEVLLEKAIAAVEEVVGDLETPGRGLYLVLPVARAGGLVSPPAEKTVPTSPPPSFDAELRGVRVSRVVEILNLQPARVRKEQSLLEAARILAQHPSAAVACVVNAEDRLVGLLPLQNLVDDLFLLVVPEDFLLETRSLDDALRFAQLSRTQTVADAMLPPISVKMDDPVKDAFRKMHKNRLPGIPVVDDARHVVGYINMLELLELYTRRREAEEKGGEG